MYLFDKLPRGGMNLFFPDRLFALVALLSGVLGLFGLKLFNSYTHACMKKKVELSQICLNLAENIREVAPTNIV